MCAIDLVSSPLFWTVKICSMYQTSSVPHPELVIQAAHENNEVVITKYYDYLKSKPSLKRLSKYYDSSLFYTAFEEAFNSAFLKFLEKIKSPGFIHRNLDGFAYRIVYNKTRDELDKLIRMRKFEEFDVQKHDRIIPTSFQTVQDWIAYDADTSLEHWFQALSVVEKKIIELRFLDYNHKEIAAELQLSEGTVRNKFSKIIQSARTYINPSLAA